MDFEVPVYVFTGFLESGKTSFIREVLDDPNFTQGERTLYLLCEEGEGALDEVLLRRTNTVAIVIDDMSMLTPAYFEQLAMEYKPDRAIIEWNGMWEIADLPEKCLPESWPVYQIVTTVNAATWELYSQNMGPRMFDHITNADMVVFNRASDAEKEKIRAKNIRAMNPRANIFFEDENGEPEDYMDNTELPFDLDAPVIEVSDLDFGLWYVDAMNDPEKYTDKTVKITGMVYKSKDFPADVFVPGRFAMVCCADDVTFVGFLCHSPEAAQYQQEDWVTVTARIKTEYYPQYRGDGPVLYATEITRAKKPDPELVYFN
ncbi:MAG: TIGR03943 family protein [Clostridia bacterium]|nr:TIGR03943 family protein [Clostridia bacterium]